MPSYGGGVMPSYGGGVMPSYGGGVMPSYKARLLPLGPATGQAVLPGCTPRLYSQDLGPAPCTRVHPECTSGSSAPLAAPLQPPHSALRPLGLPALQVPFLLPVWGLRIPNEHP